jgi:TolB protein
MSRRPIKVAAAALVFLTIFSANAFARFVFQIEGSREGAEPMAIIPFQWKGPASQGPVSIGSIIGRNLASSGRFAPIRPSRLPAQPNQSSEIRWQDWQALGINYIVIGHLAQLGPSGPNAKYAVEFQLFNVVSQQRLAGEKDQVARGGLRKAAHQISDIIYKSLTGERGAFDTQIAYVTETLAIGGTRLYAMNIADSDGFNDFSVLQSQQPIMSPAWSNDARRLAYVSFEGNRPGIYIQDLNQGTRKRVTAFPGINGAPAWSPDDSRLAMTLSKDGNPEIYVMHLGTGILRRVTNNSGIDTEPAWAPDGRSLVFTSNRGGSPQIYQIPVNGGRATRVSRYGKSNQNAVFTPDGKRLVIVHSAKGAVYRIALLDVDTGDVTVLTESRLDESPSISPNGQMIMYATNKRGRATLAAVALDGGAPQTISVDRGKVRNPAWSPFRN